MLYELFEIIQDRIKNPVEGSYTLCFVGGGDGQDPSKNWGRGGGGDPGCQRVRENSA